MLTRSIELHVSGLASPNLFVTLEFQPLLIRVVIDDIRGGKVVV
jgi:hypothetical protein